MRLAVARIERDEVLGPTGDTVHRPLHNAVKEKVPGRLKAVVQIMKGQRRRPLRLQVVIEPGKRDPPFLIEPGAMNEIFLPKGRPSME